MRKRFDKNDPAIHFRIKKETHDAFGAYLDAKRTTATDVLTEHILLLLAEDKKES